MSLLWIGVTSFICLKQSLKVAFARCVLQEFLASPNSKCFVQLQGFQSRTHMVYLNSPEIPSCAMKVDVCLPNGDGCSVEITPATPVSELQAAAQQHFQRRLTLAAKGQQLDFTATVSEAGLRDGDVVAAVAQLGKLAATERAFAWHGHGSELLTWEDRRFGGDSSQVQEHLTVLLLPFLNLGLL